MPSSGLGESTAVSVALAPHGRRTPINTLVIIPAFNEELALPKVLDELTALDRYDVVVVDDGSSDATARVARRPGVVVLSLPFNLGIGGALRCGFRYAVAEGYQRAVQLDADGQHEPDELETLLAPIERGMDLAIGSRFADQTHEYDVGTTRRRAMGVLRVVVRLLSGRSFTDTSSGFRAFSRPMLEFFAENYPSEYMESVEALLLALNEGFRVEEVPTRMQARTDGEASTLRFRLVYHYLRVVLMLVVQARRRPQERPT
jgi:glycosyltransferase involved in cell wall biosynthesis